MKTQEKTTHTEHTPTPWKIRLPIPGGKTLLMRDNVAGVWDGENVAEVFANSHGTSLQNAAFIVRAVNEFETLKTACGNLAVQNQALLEAAKMAIISLGSIKREVFNYQQSLAFEKLTDAIAQAEGRS